MRGAVFLLLSVYVLTACTSGNRKETARMEQIFSARKGLFRGLELGMPIDTVPLTEGKTPAIEDVCGYVFDIASDEGMKARAEYFNPCLTDEESRILKGILVTVDMTEEEEATDLLDRMEAKLRDAHGVPEGAFGNWEWQPRGTGLGIQLKLSPDRKQITLNYFLR